MWHDIIVASSQIARYRLSHINVTVLRPPSLRQRYFLPFSFQKVQYYTKIAADYQAAIDNILWNENEGVWLDYDVENKRPRNAFYPSNLTPLYTMSYNMSKNAEYALKAVAYLKRNKIEAFFGKFPSNTDIPA